MGKSKQQGPVRGMVSGLVAGAVGAFAMDGYWKMVQNVAGDRPEQKPKPGDRNQEEDQPSTQIMADRVSEAVTGHEVPEEHKEAAGVGVHYTTGIAFGGLCGMVAGMRARTGLVAGLLYGTAIWLFLDEIGLRVLDISPAPEKVPASQHLQALGAHFVYGSVVALATRARCCGYSRKSINRQKPRRRRGFWRFIDKKNPCAPGQSHQGYHLSPAGYERLQMRAYAEEGPQGA